MTSPDYTFSIFKQFQSSFNFCPPFCLSELKVAVNHFNFTVLHSISLLCTDLGLIDMLLTNQNAEIVACMLLVEKFRAKRCHGDFLNFTCVIIS